MSKQASSINSTGNGIDVSVCSEVQFMVVGVFFVEGREGMGEQGGGGGGGGGERRGGGGGGGVLPIPSSMPWPALRGTDWELGPP